MKEREAAQQFTCQVDRMLARLDKGADSTITPLECAGDMEVACKLAQIDFSVFSGSYSKAPGTMLRVTSGRKARNQVAWGARVADMMARRFVRPLPITIATIALAVVLIQCTYPGGVVGLTVKVEKAIGNVFDVGPHTRVQTVVDHAAVEKVVAETPQEVKDRLWSLQTPGMTWGGYTPEGISKEVLRFSTFAEARRSIKFDAKIPRALPDDFSLRDVYIPPLGMQVISVYSNAAGTVIVISQSSVGSFEENDAGSTGVMSDAIFEQIDVDGTKAAWFAAEGILVWESDNVSYCMTCRTFTLDDALDVWAGLR